MDDLLIHSLKHAYWELLERSVEGYDKKWTQAKPKEMAAISDYFDLHGGNDFVIRGKSILNTTILNTNIPLKSDTEVMQKIPTPCTPKDCKNFCGLLNYLSLF